MGSIATIAIGPSLAMPATRADMATQSSTRMR